MKVLASLSRVVFSIVVLLALACYLQSAPTIGLANFCDSITPEQLLTMLSGFNTVSVLFVIILLLGMLPFTRVLEAVWNVVFCASIIALLAMGLYEFGGPLIALPKALYGNDAVNQFCQAVSTYEVPVAITLFIFITGWLCASACGRVAITAVVSYGLWYGITSFFSYAVQLWANSDSPSMPEALHMVQSTPWIIAAVPGAFFLIYALFMAFFETFIHTKSARLSKSKKEDTEIQQAAGKKDAEENKPAAEEKKEEAGQPGADKKAAQKPVEPAAKSQPILKVTPAAPAPARKLKLAVPSAPAATEKETTADTTPAGQDVKTEKEAGEVSAEAPKAEIKTESASTECANNPEKNSAPASVDKTESSSVEAKDKAEENTAKEEK